MADGVVGKLQLVNDNAIRRGIRDVGQNRVAELMGIGNSTLVDFKEHIPRLALMLAASALRVVPCTDHSYDEDYIRSLQTLAMRGIKVTSRLEED